MNIVKIIWDIRSLFEQGKAVQFSTLVTNIEAGSAMLYGLFSSLIQLLHDLGIVVSINGTDLHTLSSGWAISASLGYGVYRTITNKSTGFTPEISVSLKEEGQS